jgi:hypothetical protein
MVLKRLQFPIDVGMKRKRVLLTSLQCHPGHS